MAVVALHPRLGRVLVLLLATALGLCLPAHRHERTHASSVQEHAAACPACLLSQSLTTALLPELNLTPQFAQYAAPPVIASADGAVFTAAYFGRAPPVRA